MILIQGGYLSVHLVGNRGSHLWGFPGLLVDISFLDGNGQVIIRLTFDMTPLVVNVWVPGLGYRLFFFSFRI